MLIMSCLREIATMIFFFWTVVTIPKRLIGLMFINLASSEKDTMSFLESILTILKRLMIGLLIFWSVSCSLEKNSGSGNFLIQICPHIHWKRIQVLVVS